MFSVAPIMCQKFAQMCLGTHGPSYHGTIIYKVKYFLVVILKF